MVVEMVQMVVDVVMAGAEMVVEVLVHLVVVVVVVVVLTDHCLQRYSASSAYFMSAAFNL